MLQLAIDSLGWSPAELNAEISARVASGQSDVRVAAAQLELSGAPVVRWVEARTTEGPTVGVDSANVTFFDAQVVGSLRAAQLAHAYDTFATSGAMAFALGLLDGHAVVVPSGWGDGRYPLAWGLDAEGVPARLAIDFGVVRFE